jgi:hypothetical protein
LRLYTGNKSQQLTAKTSAAPEGRALVILLAKLTTDCVKFCVSSGTHLDFKFEIIRSICRFMAKIEEPTDWINTALCSA